MLGEHMVQGGLASLDAAAVSRGRQQRDTEHNESQHRRDHQQSYEDAAPIALRRSRCC